MAAAADTYMVEQALIRQALRAADAVAQQLASGQAAPVLLHHSQHISVHLPSLASVARIRVCASPETADGLTRELAVARYLVERSAPIVPPSTRHPPGPYFHDQFGLTLWAYTEHEPANDGHAGHVAAAAGALRQVHAALADYPGRLPRLSTKLEACRNLLSDELALPALGASDRAVLLDAYQRSLSSLGGHYADVKPIHGDAGLHNVFITKNGALYADFQDVCQGRREWDVASLPDAAWPAFPGFDPAALASFADLVLCRLRQARKTRRCR
jgi:Ser/Thr protein kinase RdoA (MazF antagonist)